MAVLLCCQHLSGKKHLSATLSAVPLADLMRLLDSGAQIHTEGTS